MKNPVSSAIINDNGFIPRLHLFPEQLANKIILLDDAYMEIITPYFDKIECDVSSLRFHSVTGTYNKKRLTVVESGIGMDDITLVIKELDDLCNVDLNTGTIHRNFRQLEMVHVATTSSLQNDIHTGTCIVSQKSIGCDGVINRYAHRNRVCDLDFERAFTQYINWHPQWGAPYVVDNDFELAERISQNDMLRGVTISTGGCYDQQESGLRLPLVHPSMNDKLALFSYKYSRITNFDKKGSVIAGLAKLLGHKAISAYCVVDNHYPHSSASNYKIQLKQLVEKVLERI
jgi:uridine phosphorylase